MSGTGSASPAPPSTPTAQARLLTGFVAIAALSFCTAPIATAATPAAATPAAAAPAAPAPEAASPADPASFQLQEVFDLLKANLAGTSEADLNRAGVRGLLDQLAGKVTLVSQTPGLVSPAATNALSATIFDGRFAAIRLTKLNTESARQFSTTFRQLQSSNSLKGLVLDLRFTAGPDYAAAVEVADRFFATDQPLVDWGEGWRNSTSKTDAISLPLAILVNARTSGAAEVLAGILRHREIGLLIGSRTAGQASMSREFTLKTGQKLRVAVAPVKVASGQELPFSGIKPDLEVEVSAEDEVAWYEDAFRPSGRQAARAGLAVVTPVPTPPGAAAGTILAPGDPNGAPTNRAARRRMNVAELVRMSREGQTPDRDFNAGNGRSPEPAPPQVNDPALARALDLLKGLAVVQQTRSAR